jgi:hypothetical protein
MQQRRAAAQAKRYGLSTAEVFFFTLSFSPRSCTLQGPDGSVLRDEGKQQETKSVHTAQH